MTGTVRTLFSPPGEDAVTRPDHQSRGMTTANDSAAPRSRIPRGLILVLALAGILGVDSGGHRPSRHRSRAGPARLPGLLHLRPVLKGFIIGLALTIMVGQLPKLIWGTER
jgi:hypothetical protein